MAKFNGQALAGRRVVPSMECALVCLLVGLSLVGNAMDLDRKVRSAATGLIAAAYIDAPEVRVTLRGVPIPKEATVRVQAQVQTQPQAAAKP